MKIYILCFTIVIFTTAFLAQDLSALKLGVSTIQDAIELLGKPVDKEQLGQTSLDIFIYGETIYRFKAKSIALSTYFDDHRFQEMVVGISVLKSFRGTPFQSIPLHIGMDKDSALAYCNSSFRSKLRDNNYGDYYYFIDTVNNYELILQFDKIEDNLEAKNFKCLTFIDLRKSESYKELISLYGEKYAGLIRRNKIDIGMTKEMVIRSIGRPDDINRTVTKNSIHEQWVFDGKYKYLYFEDGVLTAWQD